MRIGVIADTHGVLRADAVKAFAGCDRILHAGDIGSDAVLASLQQIAPVQAIRGNVDRVGVCGSLPAAALVELAGNRFYLVHRREDLEFHSPLVSIGAVIFGHSHQPEIAWKDGVLYFNPGSAGPRRFHLPITVGLLECFAGKLRPTIHTIAA